MWKKTAKATVLALLVILASPVLVMAAQSASNNYQVNEVFFGSGGELNACSDSRQYCAKESIGETTVGNTASTNYQAQGGFNTDRVPYLEFVVNDANINLGALSTTSTKTATATFSVKTYLSEGYEVVTASDPPTNGSYVMTALTTPTAPTPGKEEFGINLVANTSPASLSGPSKDPQQIPDNTFSFGTVDANYGQQNAYMYHKGDVIARSTRSSGETDYTISYIFDVSNVTPGGTYTMDHVLIATSTY